METTAAPGPAALPAEEKELQWQDITHLLKQKLTSQSFHKTLRYFQQHEPMWQKVVSLFFSSHYLGYFNLFKTRPYDLRTFAAFRIKVELQFRVLIWSVPFQIFGLSNLFPVHGKPRCRQNSAPLVFPIISSRKEFSFCALVIYLWVDVGWHWFQINDLFPCSDFDVPGRTAGSKQDEHLGTLIFNEFTKQRMDPWTDVHYVQLQMPNRFDVTLTSWCCCW